MTASGTSAASAAIAALASAAALAVLAGGCGLEPPTHPAAFGRGAVPGEAGARSTVSAAGPAAPDSAAGALRRARTGHAWFPLTPGRYVDYRVLRYADSEPVSYVRVTAGEPEMFFGRMATPWVFGTLPGAAPDREFDGLRQYWSVGDDGSLLFHGAHNNGFMSYHEPPYRQLLADPQAAQSWSDTTWFESFFPGMEPFYRARYAHTWSTSERARLDLPGGRFHALRSSATLDILEEEFPRARRTGAQSALTPAAARALGIAREDEPPAALKGLWFTRERGLVARDWPAGPGPGNINILTFERLGEGWGPIPPAEPVP